MNMKAFLLTIIFSLLPVAVFAHGGGLNAAGCHNETKTGGYHCHRSSYTPPSSTSSSSNAFSIPSLTDTVATKEIEGTFTTSRTGLVFKNVKCIHNKWNITIVNRNDYGAGSIKILFYTVDQDGDPLATYSKYSQFIGAKSRKDYLLDQFSCSIPFKSIKYSIK